MIPFLPFTENPQLLGRLVTGLSAVVFLLGALRLFQALCLPLAEATVAGLVTALFTVWWSAEVISPDLLVGGLLLLALSNTLAVGSAGVGTRPFSAGLIYGLAYLAKAVALPISIGLIVVLQALRALIGAATPAAAVRAAALSIAGLALVSLPWIAVLSVHYGAPTFSTSGPINHAIVGPDDVERYHPTFRVHHVPEPGRITSWEDPTDLSYRTWSPFDGAAALRHQLRLIHINISEIRKKFRGFDLLGLGLTATLIAFVFHRRPWAVGFREQPWRLAAPAVAVMAGVYLPVYSLEVRYYLACYPLLLAASLGVLGDLARRVSSDPPDAIPRRQDPLLHWVAIGLVAASFTLQLVPLGLKRALTGFSAPGNFQVAQSIAAVLENAPDGALASVGTVDTTFSLRDRMSFSLSDSESVALYTAHLTGRPYYGNRVDDPLVEEVLAARAAYLVVERDSALDRALAVDARVELFIPKDRDIDGESSKWPVRIYRVPQHVQAEAPGWRAKVD